MIRKQPFGRTGHMSTVTLFGAAALGRVTQEEADRTLDVLLEYGVAVSAVAVGWSGYFNELLHALFGFTLPRALSISFVPGIDGAATGAIRTAR